MSKNGVSTYDHYVLPSAKDIPRIMPAGVCISCYTGTDELQIKKILLDLYQMGESDKLAIGRLIQTH